MGKMKIRVIVKRPDEKYGHVAHIMNTLESLQAQVGGYIEAVRLTSKVVIICNEEGRLRGMEPNIRIGGKMFVGPIVIAGIDGDEFGSIPFSFEYWEKTIKWDRWEAAT